MWLTEWHAKGGTLILHKFAHYLYLTYVKLAMQPLHGFVTAVEDALGLRDNIADVWQMFRGEVTSWIRARKYFSGQLVIYPFMAPG